MLPSLRMRYITWSIFAVFLAAAPMQGSARRCSICASISATCWRSHLRCAGEGCSQRLTQYYSDNSYGKPHRTGRLTPTLRMPYPASHYNSDANHDPVMNDACTAAKAAGFDPARFDYDALDFRAVEEHGGGDDAAIGGKGRLNNDFSFGGSSARVRPQSGPPAQQYVGHLGRSAASSGPVTHRITATKTT